ncbi:Putative phosphatase [Ignavibacterium album JCM 16511]|uniref:phosphoglycolate phosphatase n=1 Tax=Ignavibacterium album (strain DSM 19864 / JCM 16511 / NBRC 101810 / Mat9-16) TaxID=945713 RepID=I0AJF5_IGNAJ|nr:HAD family hydrolase [Ignavibacterium album]AFH49112.1 Putative phosphatase [Ignavibacterium album JCM 16511]
MNRKIKYLIWDWNGTLFNDVRLGIDIINKLLNQNNLPEITFERYRSIFTFPVSYYYKTAGFDFSKTPFEILGKLFMDEYEKRKYQMNLFDGAREILELAKNKGIGQSVLSAYKHDTLVEILKHYQISEYFENVSGLDNIYAGSKEHLGIELRKKLNFKKEEILFIGDTLHDADVAKAMDVNCVLISNGHQSAERLMDNGNIVLSDIRELKNLI